MVALTQNHLSAQYAWFCHGRSHMHMYSVHYRMSGQQQDSKLMEMVTQEGPDTPILYVIHYESKN